MVQTPITGTHAPVHIAPDKSGLNRLLCFAKDRFALSVLYFKMNVGAKQGSDPDRNIGRCSASPHIHIAPDKSGLNRLLCSAKDRFALSVLHFKMNVGAKQGSAPDHSRGASPIPLFLSQSLHSDNRVKQS